RFAVHVSTGQDSVPLQFAPPSVARMANVVPVNDVRRGTRALSVAAVGVPPLGWIIVAVRSAPAACPFVSPCVSGRISAPVPQTLFAGSGKTVAPKRAVGP